MESKLSKKIKSIPLYLAIWNYVEAALLLVAGICFLIFCQNETLRNIFLILVGTILIADGSLRIVSDFIPLFRITDAKSLHFANIVPGAFELALGITFVSTEILNVIGILATFIGILMIVGGVFLVLFGIAFIVKKFYSLYLPIVEIVLGAVLIVLGSLVLAFVTGEMMFTIFLVVIGIFFVAAAIMLIVYTTTVLREMRMAAKALAKAVEEGQTAEEAAEDKQVAPDAEFDMTGKKEENPSKQIQETPSVESTEEPKALEDKGGEKKDE